MDHRQRIISALKELSATRGFYRVTVDELAARAGMSKRTIYRYFSSKEEIINAALEEFISTVAKKVRQALDSSSDPVEKILGVIRTLMENIKFVQPLALYDLQKHYPHLWEKIEQFRAGKIQQIFDEVLTGDDQGRFRQVNPKIFTTALLSSVRAVVNPAFIVENNITPEEAIKSLFTIFLHGVVRDGEDF